MPYWTEIGSSDEGTYHIKNLFFKDDDKKPKQAEQYGRMAYLLTERKRFETALETVSKDLWEIYANKIAPGSNRLTRSIQYYGARLGFRSYINDQSARAQHVVYVDNLDGGTFVANIRNKILWKDSFGFGHGEFSHSFQWLAASVALGWDSDTAELYAGTTRRAKVQMYVQEGSALKLRSPTLWQWLVDCVNEKSDKPPCDDWGPHRVHYRHCFSNSYRFANEVQKFVVSTAPGWFIGAYAGHRQDVLNWHVANTRNVAQQLIDTAPTVKQGFDTLNKRQKEAFVGEVIAGSEGAQRYNQGVAQRASLKDHYAGRGLNQAKSVVDRRFKVTDELDRNLEPQSGTYHGIERYFYKLKNQG